MNAGGGNGSVNIKALNGSITVPGASVASGTSANSGTITLTATGSITSTGDLAGQNFAGSSGGTGGTIVLNSGTGTFNLGNLFVNSNGGGAGGNIDFYNSGNAAAPGSPIVPSVTFLSGSRILTLGTGSSRTHAVAVNLINNFTLADVQTQNLGTGGAGDITITSAGSLTFTSTVQANSSGNATAGNIVLTANGGNLSTSAINSTNTAVGASAQLRLCDIDCHG